MDNQKGSIKDRIRARLLYLKYKKNKIKKLNEIKKKKKREYEARVRAEQIRIYGKPYSKFKAFSLTIVGLLFGLLTPKSTKNSIENELDLIDKEKKQVFLKLEQDQNIKDIYNKIDNVYQKLENIKKSHKTKLVLDCFNPKSNNKLLNKIDEKQKELIVINEICHQREKQQNSAKFTDINNKKNFIKENTKSNINIEEKRICDAIKKENNENKSIIKNSVGLEESKDTINYDSTNALSSKDILKIIKDMNSNIKEYSKELVSLKGKIDAEELYNTLFDYEFKLRQLKIRLKKVLENYNILDEKYDLEQLNNIIDIELMDKFDLKNNNKSIINKIEECNILLNKIEEKKKVITQKPNDASNDKKAKVEINDDDKIENKKTVKKEEKKQKLVEQFDDIYLANKIIINSIIEEKRNLDRIQKKLLNLTPLVRKKSVFYYAKSFTSSFLHFGLSLFPIKYFQNKFMGTLVSSIMLNNSLRTTRKILTYDTNTSDYIVYNNIINSISSNQNYTNKIYEMCIDSQEQIRNIKENLNVNFAMLREYDSDLFEFNRQLDNLYEDLEYQALQLNSMNNNYKTLKRKVKMKSDINY